MEAYQGYFEGGRFFPFDSASIPERKRAIVTILDEPIPDNDIAKRRAVWRDFFDAVKASDEPVPESFERVNFTRDIDL